MEATVLNKDFMPIAVIDNYKSFIWTERYDEYGDFDLSLPLEDTLPSYIQKGYYLWKEGSNRLMIIESISVDSSEEDGLTLLVTGRSLESILTRRVVWTKRVFVMKEVNKKDVYPSLQDTLISLLTENIITDGVRNIPNFVIEPSTDPRILELTIEGEYLGQELYEVVSNACKEKEIGFKMEYHESYIKDNNTYDNAFVFSLYKGEDRSYNQSENPYVIFSPEFGNIANTNYIDSVEDFKNVALVVGESTYKEDGTEESRIQNVISADGTSTDPIAGLERRELFVDATGESTNDDNNGTIAMDRYKAMLKQKGIDGLIEHSPIQALEGEVEYICSFEYRKDYYVGDTVQLVNEYGYEGQAYISEYVESCDESGFNAYPTFNVITRGWYESDE